MKRSCLVTNERRTWSPLSQELFAPSLAVGQGLMVFSQAQGLETVILDVKDADLNFPQLNLVIGVDGRFFGGPAQATLSVSFLGKELLLASQGAR